MKQKENIFEELGRMRSLIHTRPGVVISEQANPSVDVGQMMRQLDAFNTNEDEVVNIIKRYKDRASFKGFVDQYKAISGKEFATELIKSLSPTNDKTEWNDLTNYLKTLGIVLTYEVRDPRKGGAYAIFGGIGTPTVKPKVEPKVAPKVEPKVANNDVTKRRQQYTKSVGDETKSLQTSLGINPSGQLSDADIDMIIKKLEGGEVSGDSSSQEQSIPMDANGQPDIDKILASLEQ